ncbi:MAG: O-antigen ligase family protein [Candidatus Omnitrophota bacterium]
MPKQDHSAGVLFSERSLRVSDRHLLKAVLFFIIFKMLFDLFWRVPLFEISGIAFPIHRVVAAFVPCALIAVLVSRVLLRKTVVFNRSVLGGCFVLLTFISLLFNAGMNTYAQYSRLMNFMLIFFAVPMLFRDEKQFVKVVVLLLWVSFIPTLISYLQAHHILPFSYYDVLPGLGNIGRISGGYHHPTGYLNYLLVLFPAGIYIQRKDKRFYWLMVVWVVLTFPMVVRSFHRAAMILFLLQCLIFLLLTETRKRKIFFLVCLLVLLGIFSSHLWALINQGNSITDLHFRGRDLIWSRYLDHFQRLDPWQKVIGQGTPILPSGGGDEPHSDWIRLLISYGAVGIVLYVSFLASMGMRFFSFFVYNQKGMRYEGLIGLTLIMTLVLYSVTMEPLRYSSFTWLFGLVLGYVYMRCVPPVFIRVSKPELK